MIKLVHINSINIITLIMLISVFMPFPPFIFGTYGEVSCLLAIVSMLFVLMFSGAGKVDRPAFLICVSLFSLLLIAILRDNERVFSDFLELSRPFMWFVTYSLFFSVCLISDVEKLISRILSTLYFVAVWGIVEVFIPDHSLFHDLYKLDASVYRNKAIASFIAPYSFAAVMGIGFAISYARLRSGCLPPVKGYLILGLFFTAIILAQSKSGILGMVIITLAFEVRYPRIVSAVFMILICTILFYIIVSFKLLPYVSQFISVVWEAYLDRGVAGLAGSTPSIGNRMDQLEAVNMKIDELPIIGAGVGKGYLYLESLYALWLFRYGILGFVILASVCLRGMYISGRLRSEFEVCSLRKALLTAFPFITLYFFVVSISSNVIDQFRVALFYIAIIAIIRAMYVNNKKVWQGTMI